jgi:hypothetical protein
MSRPIIRPKNRRHPRAPQPSNPHLHTTRTLLWPMLRNLQLKPQLYTHRIRNSPTEILWKLIPIYTLSTLWSYRSIHLLS